MKLRFATDALRDLESSDLGEYSESVVERYRSRVNLIRCAPDERDFYALKSLHFERLSGRRSHQYSMRLNIQWRLILEFNGEGSEKTVTIIGIEDYH